MSVESRLAQLEKQAGISNGDVCACSSFSREVRTYMDAEDNRAEARADERPPQVCERCGKPKDVIKIVVVYGRNQAEVARLTDTL